MTPEPSKTTRTLREELRYWQGQATIEARWLEASRKKCAAIEAQISALEPKPVTRPDDWRPGKFEGKAEQRELL